MKIKKVHFEDHPFFGTMDIDFSGSDGRRTLNTVVVAGINGSGKTTLLNAVVDMMTNADNRLEKSYVEVELTELYEKNLLKWKLVDLDFLFAEGDDEKERRRELIEFNIGMKGKNRYFTDKFKELENGEKPRMVYMPTEINFSKMDYGVRHFQAVRECRVNTMFTPTLTRKPFVEDRPVFCIHPFRLFYRFFLFSDSLFYFVILLFRQRCSGQRWDQVKALIKNGRR